MKPPAPTFLYSGNAAFLDELYERYLDSPDSVPAEWRAYFSQLRHDADRGPADVPRDPTGRAFSEERQRPQRSPTARPGEASDVQALVEKQVAVLQLINAHRFLGHRVADLDPLRQHERPDVPELEPHYHGLGDADLDTVFNTGSLFGPKEAALRDILALLRSTYCRSIGAEYMHITDTAQKRWIQQRLEADAGQPRLSVEERLQILGRLVAASSLEEYLHTKYVGQKRFSLEGGESLIPLLDRMIQDAGIHGVREVVIGMAHRGRLNVLVNIVGKMPQELFDEFEGRGSGGRGSGDVKYHLGFSADISTPGGAVHVALAFNPSHLEIIDPVVQGSVRARQDRRRDKTRNTVLPILLHGDAAFAGQGVVMETLNLSQTRGYSTGGTVHVVVNNQIGFTTSDPLDSRSTLYCTDVAKMVQSPIFHVNADNPEAVVMITRLALDFRMEFNKDVVIDLVCFRRHGHSEADEPSATQPGMYQRVRQHPGARVLYTRQLEKEGLVTEDQAAAMAKDYVAALEDNRTVSRPLIRDAKNEFLIDYEPFKGTHWTEPCETAISASRVRSLSERCTALPQGFKLHPTVKRIMENRRQMGDGRVPMDWGYAETLAYASLLEDGYPIRISGQDSARGTFFHRHAVVHDQDSGDTYLPLQNITPGQPQFLVINSILSEEAVLGFEFGYSSSEPGSLVIWEAQFGDFANGAQVVIDQFITSSEAKWGRYCGLVLLLPHGYDGQGPEHSSARLERYLQLCAEENIQVCFPSTPAQIFHLLRRQMLRPFRKPLVVMSPKSLLRHKLAVSSLEEITEGGFRTVIDEIDPLDPDGVERLLVCSGKVFYDLLEARRAHGIQSIAILRLEQLYPFPKEEMEALINRYPNAKEVIWVQEEPRNQGAWVYLLARLHLFGCLHEPQILDLVARPYSASPAVGYMSKHLEQQQALINSALKLDQFLAGEQQQKRA